MFYFSHAKIQEVDQISQMLKSFLYIDIAAHNVGKFIFLMLWRLWLLCWSDAWSINTCPFSSWFMLEVQVICLEMFWESISFSAITLRHWNTDMIGKTQVIMTIHNLNSNWKCHVWCVWSLGHLIWNFGILLINAMYKCQNGPITLATNMHTVMMLTAPDTFNFLSKNIDYKFLKTNNSTKTDSTLNLVIEGLNLCTGSTSAPVVVLVYWGAENMKIC